MSQSVAKKLDLPGYNSDLDSALQNALSLVEGNPQKVAVRLKGSLNWSPPRGITWVVSTINDGSLSEVGSGSAGIAYEACLKWAEQIREAGFRVEIAMPGWRDEVTELLKEDTKIWVGKWQGTCDQPMLFLLIDVPLPIAPYLVGVLDPDPYKWRIPSEEEKELDAWMVNRDNIRVISNSKDWAAANSAASASWSTKKPLLEVEEQLRTEEKTPASMA